MEADGTKIPMSEIELASGDFIAICRQMDVRNAADGSVVDQNVAHMEEMSDWAVEGSIGLARRTS